MADPTICVYWADLSVNPRSEADLIQTGIPQRPYRTAHLRRLSLLSKWLLKQALGSRPPYPEEPLRELRYHRDGKPYLPRTPYAFSLSHSGQLATCAVATGGPVGIDIQQRVRLRPGNERLFMTGPEQERVAGEDTLALWSQKEAAFKAFGHELNARLTDFRFEQSQRLYCGPVAVELLPLRIQADYVGYVAFQRQTGDTPVLLTLEYL